MEEAQKNPDVILQNYKIISKYFEKEEENEFQLPTPECLQKLCEPQTVKNLLSFDFKKYSSYFEEDKLNLDKIESIKDAEMAKFLLIFLGYINGQNDIYKLYDENIQSPEENFYIENLPDYLNYMNKCIDYLKNNNKLLNTLTDLNTLIQILSDLGINIENNEKNVFFSKIKNDLFLANEKNKILILIAPSNNFWIKSEKSVINDINYDIKLNNYNNIFYNKKFILKFMEKVTRNPRCVFGLISSMVAKNLKNSWEALGKLDVELNKLCPKNVIYIDQKFHNEMKLDKDNPKKKSFFRNMTKIISYFNKDKAKNKDQENTGYFNANNILILESEPDKMSDDTKNNSIRLNIFNEEYLLKDEKEKAAIDLDVDKFIEYLINLFNNCGEDIRAYIKENPFKN